MMRTLQIFLLAIPLFFTTIASADTWKSHDFSESSGVFRLREVRGEVWVRPGLGSAWEEAYGNMPVTVGYEIATETEGFADIEVDSETHVRLGGDTTIALTDAGWKRVDFEYTEGSIYVSRLSGRSEKAVIFSIGHTDRILFSNRGAFRIDETAGGTVAVAVREGRISLTRFGKEYLIKEKEMAWLDENLRFSMAYSKDSWDAFNEKRDNDLLAFSLPSHIDEAVAGRYDIDRYGDWLVVPAYGYVWRPRVVISGWAPFLYGKWVFLSPFGWTWVSLEPWGWITYHYGSWVTISNYGWVWVPSAEYRFWHPARARIIFEANRVRWVPLRPGERTVRYRSRLLYRRYVNVINRGAVFSRPVFVNKGRYVIREYTPFEHRGHRKKWERGEPAFNKRSRHDAARMMRRHDGEKNVQKKPWRYERKKREKEFTVLEKDRKRAVKTMGKRSVRSEVKGVTRSGKMITDEHNRKKGELMLPRSEKRARERKPLRIGQGKIKNEGERKVTIYKGNKGKKGATAKAGNRKREIDVQDKWIFRR